MDEKRDRGREFRREQVDAPPSIFGGAAYLPSQAEVARNGYGPGGRLSFGYMGPRAGDRNPMEISYDGVRMGLLVAPPRSGKGTTLNRFALRHPSGFVGVDPRGEMAIASYRYRRDVLKQRCVLIDPCNIVAPQLGVKADSINILDIVNPESPFFFENALAVSDGLITPTDSHQKFWDEASLGYTTTAVMGGVAHCESDRRPSLPEVLDVFSLPQEDFEHVLGDPGMDPAELQGLKAAGVPDDQLPPNEAFGWLASPHDLIRKGAAQIAGADGKVRSNVLSTLHANLRVFNSPVVRQALSTSSFDLNELPRGKMTIYIVIPTSLATLLGPFIRLLVTTCLYVVSRSQLYPDPPVLTVWDETYLAGKSETLLATLGVQSGDGNQLVTVWHDFSQIERLYGDSWHSFVSTAGFIAAFSNSDLSTQTKLSEMCGDTDISLKSRETAWQAALPHRDGNYLGMKDERITRRLIPPEVIKNMAPWEALFIPAGMNPIIGFKAPYYLDAKFRRGGHALFDQPRRYAGRGLPPAINFEKAGRSLSSMLSKHLKHG